MSSNSRQRWQKPSGEKEKEKKMKTGSSSFSAGSSLDDQRTSYRNRLEASLNPYDSDSPPKTPIIVNENASLPPSYISKSNVYDEDFTSAHKEPQDDGNIYDYLSPIPSNNIIENNSSKSDNNVSKYHNPYDSPVPLFKASTKASISFDCTSTSLLAVEHNINPYYSSSRASSSSSTSTQSFSRSSDKDNIYSSSNVNPYDLLHSPVAKSPDGCYRGRGNQVQNNPYDSPKSCKSGNSLSYKFEEIAASETATSKLAPVDGSVLRDKNGNVTTRDENHSRSSSSYIGSSIDDSNLKIDEMISPSSDVKTPVDVRDSKTNCSCSEYNFSFYSFIFWILTTVRDLFFSIRGKFYKILSLAYSSVISFVFVTIKSAYWLISAFFKFLLFTFLLPVNVSIRVIKWAAGEKCNSIKERAEYMMMAPFTLILSLLSSLTRNNAKNV